MNNFHRSPRPLLALTLLAALFFSLIWAVLPASAAPVDVYTTPGQHAINGREWSTSCYAYSSTINRCSTELLVDGEWVHNNLTYLPVPRGWWGDNPMANTGEWTDGLGYEWRTECDTAATGRGACRVYIWDGFTWVVNNIVLFGAPYCPEYNQGPLSPGCYATKTGN